MPARIDEIIGLLELEPLPAEGGFYRGTFTAELQNPAAAPPASDSHARPLDSGRFAAAHPP